MHLHYLEKKYGIRINLFEWSGDDYEAGTLNALIKKRPISEIGAYITVAMKIAFSLFKSKRATCDFIICRGC